MFDYKGKVVVISGASSGLGAQMARGFAAQGADLVIMARRMEKLEALAGELAKSGREVWPVRCDVTDSAMVDSVAAQVEARFGHVDVLINCAASAAGNGVLETANDEWDFTIATDMTSVFYVTRAFGNIMKKKKYGRIINIASLFGMVGNTSRDAVAYCTSKGGVINFTRAVAAELAKYNITCNAISPGYFATEVQAEAFSTEEFTAYLKSAVPLGRCGKEGELNAAAVFLGSEEASYVTGIVLPVDGGYTAV